MAGIIHIAICEDNKEHTEILKCMINRWAEKQQMKVDIGCYSSAEEFLFYMKEDVHYDLAFLDIQLEKMNGLQLAKLIRAEDKTMFLVFTTGEKGYALKGYEVSAYRYLIKPLKEEDICSMLSQINKLVENSKRDAVVISYDDVSRRISKNEIVYIEVDDHYIILHMVNKEDIKFRAKLKEFEAQFQEPQFCKCHRSYIANMHYVERVSREGLLLEGEIKLPISRARWEALNKCYISYYTAR